MRRTYTSFRIAAFAIAAVTVVAACTAQDRAVPGAAPAGSSRIKVLGGKDVTLLKSLQHDVSPALRDIVPAQPEGGEGGDRDKQGNNRTFILPHPKGDGIDRVTQTKPVKSAGPVQAAPNGVPVQAAPITGAGFDTVGRGFSTFAVNSAPPDTDAAVGLTQIVTVVNAGFAVQDKSGAILYGPAATNTVFTGFGGACETTNDGDAVVRYDRAADRWLMSQFANVRSSSGPYYECVAVSTTGDARGTWNRYSFQYANFPDYPKVGVWPDAYYITYNMFNPAGTTFLGTTVCAIDRASMLAGQAATQQCFATTNVYGGLLPADVDSATAPPVGQPNLVIGQGATSTTLAYWNFHVDFAAPANSTFTGPSTLAVSGYTPACSGGTCIAQPNTTNKLDSLADRMMNRFAYRNFGDHQALVVSQSVTAGSSVGVRWYEIRLSGPTSAPTPSMFQQGTYAIDASYRWMPSAALDKVGNIGVGYSLSSSTVLPSIAFSGRLAGDALGALTQGETISQAGGGSQTGSLTRWGDYATMNIDPADDCTFWFSTEYLKSSGTFNWSTHINSFKLPGCASPVVDDFTISATPTAGSVVQGSPATTTVNTTTVGNPETVALSVSGLPSGAGASFNPVSISSGGSSTLTITTTAVTTPGTYPITITGTGSAASAPVHSTSYALAVTAPVAGGVVNGGFETGSLSGWTPSGALEGVVTSPAPHGGTFSDRGGNTAPTNGDSKVVQTFTAPTGSTKVSFWYLVSCPDTVRYDWATATLKDNTTAKTTTVLAKTCTNGGGWKQITATLVAGHSYTLSLVSHDDNYATDPTFALFDDVVVQ